VLVAHATDPAGVVATSTPGQAFTASPPTIAFAETVSKVTLPASSVAGAKTKAVVTVRVTNNGNVAPTTSSEVEILLTPDGSPSDGTQVVALPESLKNKPGVTKTVTIPLRVLPSVAAGPYYVAVQVTDPDKDVTSAASSETFAITAAV
jgi:hypothetical protein